MHPLTLPPVESPNWPFPNIDVTNSPSEQDEPMVVINPYDSLNIIIGANDDRSFNTLWAYASTDGGNSWSNTALPIPAESWMLNSDATDPSLAFATSGEALYVNGHLNLPQNDVACFASSDKGFTWVLRSEAFQDSAASVDTASDKYFVTVDRDPSSPFLGRVYVTWVELEPYPFYARVVAAFSTDDGVSWSTRRPVSGLGHYIAPVPVTEPDGTLLIAYEDYFPNNQILVARSTDGGNTFGAPEAVSVYTNLGPLFPADSMGQQNIGPPDSAFNVNSFPAIAVDSSSAHAGRAYLVWCGKASDDLAHLWLSVSDNDGASWSTPRAIEQDSVPNASSRFFPWIAVDPMTGNVGIDYYVTWMDTVPPKQSTGTLMMQAALYMLHSTDGGGSFASRRISSAIFDPISGDDARTIEGETLWFFGDYIGLAGHSNRWYPAWTDARSGEPDIYTAVVQPFAPMPVTDLAAHDTLINGRHISFVSWQYVPQTTFGYPLGGGYQFAIAKDGIVLVTRDSSKLSFLDTNAQTGNEYEITVLSGKYRSVTDSVANGSSDVSQGVIPAVSIRFANSPARSGVKDDLIMDCPADCRVSLLFYDELGRERIPAMTDRALSTHHEISFFPDNPGVWFYELKISARTGSRELFGKLSVTE